MKPVRSSFPNALSPCRRRPSSVLVAACRAVAALPLSLSSLAVQWPPFPCPCRRLPCSGRPSAVLVAACRAVPELLFRHLAP